MQHSESIKSIAGAILKFQGKVSGVHRDGKNPAFKSRYATLENVIDTIRPGLQEVGLMFTQSPGSIVDGSLELCTLLVHAESGEWMRGTMHIPLAKRDPQGTGSALTYSMRYSIMALLGLPPVDDDGEAAIDRNPPKQEAKPDASKNDDARNLYATLETAMRLATTKAELRTWWSNPTNVSARNRLPSSWQGNLREESIKLAESLPEGHAEERAA